MARVLRAWLSLLGAAGGVGLAACSPEVLLARTEQPPSTAGSGANAGVSGGGADGSGGTVPLGAVAGMDAGGAAEAEAPRLLADSVADFSLEQGKLGWFYGYDLGSVDTFAPMTRTSVITNYKPATMDVWDCWVTEEPHWTQLFQLGAHPNGTDTSPPSTAVLERAVRRWLSSFEGNVVISGEIAKIDAAVADDSNGIDASVYVDGTSLYTTFIGAQDGGGLSYEVKATLHRGSMVDFVLDPHEGNDHHDLSRFTGIVARDEPARAE
jgi:hypothetical protein